MVDQSNKQVSRRAVLAAGSGGIASSFAGCTQDLQQITSGASNQVSITILTLPTDNDRQSIRIARQFEKNLKAVGIDTTIEPRSDPELLRAILLDHDFDCYIGRHPGGHDPNFLYEMFHSAFAPEAGWQNPFGFTDSEMDELLERQHSVVDGERKKAVGEVLHQLAQTHPIVPICIPDNRRLVRTDRFDGWNDRHLGTRLGFLDLERNEDKFEDESEAILTAVITDTRPSQNINPLAAEYRHRGPFIDLLYDSLAVKDKSDIRPWLAESWEWDDSVATVTLRPNCRFHDGEPVTAADVEFTYNFLADTSLGEGNSSSPAPRYRGMINAIEMVEAVDELTIRIRVGTNVDVSELAFTIPILPKHLWEAEVEERFENGVEPTQGTWDVVTADSMPKIGSGPYAFADQKSRSHLRFERVDNHFSLREDIDLPAPTVNELVFRVEPNHRSAVDQLETGNADVMASVLEPDTIGDTTDGKLELLEPPSRSFYHVGFNTRNPPFNSPHFRENVARLIDRESLVEEIFNGRATSTVAPVIQEWIPDDLEWDGEAPYAPFFRNEDETSNGDTGEVDVEQAKRVFEENGFEYDDHGRLVRY